MNILIWLHYKWLADYRATWQGFKIGGKTVQGKLLVLSRLGLRLIGLALSLLLGLGIGFLSHHILGLTTDLSWLLYITLLYVLGPILDSKQVSYKINPGEYALLQSTLGVHGAKLTLVALAYYMEFTIYLTALADAVMLLGCALVLKTPVLLALFIFGIGQVLRFALIFLDLGLQQGLMTMRQVKARHRSVSLRLYGMVLLGVIIIILRLALGTDYGTITQPFAINTFGTHLISAVQGTDFTSLGLYSWYPGTMILQVALYGDLWALLKLSLALGIIVTLGYLLAVLNAHQGQQHVTVSAVPMVMDGLILKRLHRHLNLTYTYVTTLFLDPKFARGKTLLFVLSFASLLLIVVTRFVDPLSRFVLIFIGILGLLAGTNANFKLGSPLVFSLSELRLWPNLKLATLWRHKITAAFLAYYLEILLIGCISVLCLHDFQALITVWLWTLLLLLGKISLTTFGSRFLLMAPTNTQTSNKATVKALLTLRHLSSTPPWSLVLLVFYDPHVLTRLSFTLIMVSYLVLANLMCGLILGICQRHDSQGHVWRLLGLIVGIGIGFGLPLLGMFSHFYPSAIQLLFGLSWLRLLWLCFNFVHNQPP
ncbi:MAG: hypothetical protein LKF36_14240 [Lactobacillus sp.]|jgi:hypothetical protein|nr:hypothetical protein [Lactobacillus sp.]